MRKSLLLFIFIYLILITGCSKEIGIKDTVSPIIISSFPHGIIYEYGKSTPSWVNSVIAFDNTIKTLQIKFTLIHQK